MSGSRLMTVILACTVSFAVSCTKARMETSWASQEEKIDKFINSLPQEEDPNNPDLLYVKDVIRNGGTNRVIMLDGEGEKLKKGGTVTFYYSGHIFNGNISMSNMFATNNKHMADSAKWELNEATYEAVTATLNSKGGLVEGLRLGLEGVRAGEMCCILFSGKYGFGKKPFGIIPGNSALAYQIWVESVSN